MFGDLKLEVYDKDGKLLSTLPGGKRRGLNRVEWPMRVKGPRVAAGGRDRAELLRVRRAASAARAPTR